VNQIHEEIESKMYKVLKHSESRNSQSDYASKNATFNLVKKLILFPEIL
jgi:hypothetical protein